MFQPFFEVRALLKHYIKLFKAFGYAFQGIWTVLRDERNFRIHLTCICYMLGFLLLTDWFVLSRADWAILLLACALVLSLEIVNTALESVVDLATQERRPLAKRAKDAAAGAVLIAAVFAVIVGLVILLQPAAFRAMFAYFSTHLPAFALFVLSIIPATLFIFFGFGKGKRKDG